MPDFSSVLMLALGMLARDPQGHLTPDERAALRTRLQHAHARNLPLVLTPTEREVYRVRLLGYVALHRPRILPVVCQALAEEG